MEEKEGLKKEKQGRWRCEEDDEKGGRSNMKEGDERGEKKK